MQKVSLILTTYNSAENLRKTLQSIDMQDYAQIEVNIKDGGSTDETIAVIENYEKHGKFPLNWISCADKGIYDAMNQGYALTGGEIIVFFNDLFLHATVVSEMLRLIERNPDCIGAHADLVYTAEGKVVRYWKMGPQKSLYWGWMPGHPTLFLKREIYEKYGLYDDSYRIAADYEFMVRFLKDRENRLVYLPKTIIEMYYGGTSTSDLGSYWLSLKEGYRALKVNKVHGALWISGIRTCRVLLQFISIKISENEG